MGWGDCPRGYRVGTERWASSPEEVLLPRTGWDSVQSPVENRLRPVLGDPGRTSPDTDPRRDVSSPRTEVVLSKLRGRTVEGLGERDEGGSTDEVIGGGSVSRTWVRDQSLGGTFPRVPFTTGRVNTATSSGVHLVTPPHSRRIHLESRSHPVNHFR